MPKKPVDYSKTIIYTIVSKDSIYVGSTTNYTKRKYQHKISITNENGKSYNLKLYKTIRENEEWNIQPHSKFPCNDGVEQKLEEQRIRTLLKADLNMISCGTGLNHSVLGEKEYKKQYYTENKDKLSEQQKQYKTDNKDKISEQNKHYYTENKDKISEKQKQYYTENKDKLSEQKKQYYTENKDKLLEYHKQYYTENKDKVIERQQQYYTENKDKIAEYKKQKVTCECGCIVTKQNLTRHRKLPKHMKLMENK